MKRKTLLIACLGGSAFSAIAAASAALDGDMVVLYPYYMAKEAAQRAPEQDTFVLTLEYNAFRWDDVERELHAAVDSSRDLHGKGRKNRRKDWQQSGKFSTRKNQPLPREKNRRRLMRINGHL